MAKPADAIALSHIPRGEEIDIGRLSDKQQADHGAKDRVLASEAGRLLDEIAAGLHQPAHFGNSTRDVADQMQQVEGSTASKLSSARRGLGIGVMTREMAERLPGVECVLPDFGPFPVPIWLTTHCKLHTSRRIRLVFDILAEVLP